MIFLSKDSYRLPLLLLCEDTFLREIFISFFFSEIISPTLIMDTELDTDTDTDTDDDDNIDNIYEEVLNENSSKNNQNHIKLSNRSSHRFGQELQNNQHQVKIIYQYLFETFWF